MISIIYICKYILKWILSKLKVALEAILWNHDIHESCYVDHHHISSYFVLLYFGLLRDLEGHVRIIILYVIYFTLDSWGILRVCPILCYILYFGFLRDLEGLAARIVVACGGFSFFHDRAIIAMDPRLKFKAGDITCVDVTQVLHMIFRKHAKHSMHP